MSGRKRPAALNIFAAPKPHLTRPAQRWSARRAVAFVALASALLWAAAFAFSLWIGA